MKPSYYIEGWRPRNYQKSKLSEVSFLQELNENVISANVNVGYHVVYLSIKIRKKKHWHFGSLKRDVYENTICSFWTIQE